MTAVQLEFNIENKSEEELKLSLIQKQVDDMQESIGKVRRKLFAEMGEMKKLLTKLQEENKTLMEALGEMKNEKITWTYGQEDCLFNVREYKKA